ncbi:MAG: 2-dehydropantoate 2-reductase [candidate division NC10 bacterium]|nr:2-dehydropantoate 2-reductase [candidate division NC10 bacterium]
MKVAVMGAGAVGGYFGGVLAKHDVEVSFIARGRHLEALRAKSLVVKSYQGDFSVPIKATSDPGEIGPVDLILFAVKSYDTERAIQRALPMVGPNTILLSLQNGVDNGEKMAAVVGKEKVLEAAVYIGASIPEPGVIIHTAGGRIIFGEPEGGISERVRKLEDFFKGHGVQAEASPNVRVPQWSKFAWNVAFNAINTLIGGPVGRVIANPQTLELAKRTIAEVIEIAKALRIHLPDDLIERHVQWTLTMGPDIKTSTLQDLEAGKPLEVEAFNGFVVRKGQELGIPTPCNFALYALLSAL